MKKLLYSFVFFILFISIFEVTLAESIIVKQASFIWKKPSILSGWVGYAKENEEYTVLEETNGWLKIQITNDTTGYIKKEFAIDSKNNTTNDNICNSKENEAVIRTGQILFRGLPWVTTNPKELKALLDKEDFSLVQKDKSNVLYLDKYISQLNRTVVYENEFSKTFCGWFCNGVNLKENGGPSVAGYTIANAIGYFYCPIINGKVDTNEENARFYCAEYIFKILNVDNAFNDLVKKLSNLYAEGYYTYGVGQFLSDDLRFEKGDLIRYTIEGTDNTILILEKVSGSKGGSLTLRYGQRGYEENCRIADEILLENEYQRRLNEENNTDRTDDYSGL